MTLNDFFEQSISPWMREEGPEDDIVLSSRVRLARNFVHLPFPTVADQGDLARVSTFLKNEYADKVFANDGQIEFVAMNALTEIERKVLVEKHLISPHLANVATEAGALISENEQVSMMVNEEDHLRIQIYYQGFQLEKALDKAFKYDDWLEEKTEFAFDEAKGYLTSCPTNMGTGMRASVMMHLPALVFTKQISLMLPIINQLGFVVRGIYGEGSEALGNLFQVSNQITLGKSEEDIVDDLRSIVTQLVKHERKARHHLLDNLTIRLENRVFRSYGILEHSRIIESKEAAKCLSNVRLGIDLGIIKDTSKNILHELMILTQPGFLQYYANKPLTISERDILRASLIRERLKLAG